MSLINLSCLFVCECQFAALNDHVEVHTVILEAVNVWLLFLAHSSLYKKVLFPPNSQPDGNNSHHRHDVPISPQHIVVQLPTSDKWIFIHCLASLSFCLLKISRFWSA